MNTARIIKKIIARAKHKTTLFKDEDCKRIQKEVEEEKRKFRESQKISHEEMNTPMDI